MACKFFWSDVDGRTTTRRQEIHCLDSGCINYQRRRNGLIDIAVRNIGYDDELEYPDGVPEEASAEFFREMDRLYRVTYEVEFVKGI